MKKIILTLFILLSATLSVHAGTLEDIGGVLNFDSVPICLADGSVPFNNDLNIYNAKPNFILNSSKDGSWDVGEVKGEINFYSADSSGSGSGNHAWIKSVSYDTFGANTDLIFGTANNGGEATEKMRLTKDGKLEVEVINNIRYVKAGNSTDLQNQISECSSDCKVIIPPGTYEISSGLHITGDSVTIEGSGSSTIIKQAASSNLNYIFWFDDSDYSSISNLYIDGNEANQVSGDGRALYITSSARFRIQNLWIWDTYGDAIYLGGSDSSTSSHASQISNVMIYGSGDDGLQIDSFAYDSEINNLWIAESTDNGVEIYSGSNFFNNLHVWGANDNGVFIRSDRNKFSNFYIESNSNVGFESFGRDLNKFSNGYVWKNGGKGFQLEGAEGNLINNVEVFNNTGEGIAMSSTSKDNQISNSVISYSGSHGITLVSSDNNIINGNIISYNNLRGVSCSSCSSNTINNNQVYNNGQGGISSNNVGIDLFTASQQNTIMGNTIYDTSGTQENGVKISGSSDYNIISLNVIYDNTISQINNLTTGTNNIILNNIEN